MQRLIRFGLLRRHLRCVTATQCANVINEMGSLRALVEAETYQPGVDAAREENVKILPDEAPKVWRCRRTSRPREEWFA
jgi:hypothetical protein